VTESQAATTRFCARVAGPFLILIAVTVFVRYDTLPLLLPSLLQDAPLVLVTGMWTAMLGLIVLSAHHHFGSPAAGAITVLGIVLVLRGTLLLVMPETLIAVGGAFVRAPPIMYIVTALTLLLGAWLTFVGWFARKV
jgi:hypothetical protein